MTLSLLWKLLFWGWFASEILVGIVTRTKRSGGKVQDRGSLIILWIVIFASITACQWFSETHAATMFGGAHALKIAGVIVMLAALAVRWTAIFTLGKFFSANVAIHDSHQIVRTGLYRFVRHPSYLGLLLHFSRLACIRATGSASPLCWWLRRRRFSIVFTSRKLLWPSLRRRLRGLQQNNETACPRRLLTRISSARNCQRHPSPCSGGLKPLNFRCFAARLSSVLKKQQIRSSKQNEAFLSGGNPRKEGFLTPQTPFGMAGCSFFRSL